MLARVAVGRVLAPFLVLIVEAPELVDGLRRVDASTRRNTLPGHKANTSLFPLSHHHPHHAHMRTRTHTPLHASLNTPRQHVRVEASRVDALRVAQLQLGSLCSNEAHARVLTTLLTLDAPSPAMSSQSNADASMKGTRTQVASDPHPPCRHRTTRRRVQQRCSIHLSPFSARRLTLEPRQTRSEEAFACYAARARACAPHRHVAARHRGSPGRSPSSPTTPSHSRTLLDAC
ncbi:hypothetical protein V8E36_008620 [Tilletia maclaganii]